ncbi:MAG: AlpA family phage regulatory protein [Myxococcales bacterium]|jgi:prophage regulatory protein|nr:AlpA family phage regulatory protein [Myxococcales bacterium]
MTRPYRPSPTGSDPQPETPAAPPFETLLTMAEVNARVKLGETAIRERIAAGTFPAPLIAGPRCVRWVESEVIAWRESLSRAVYKPGKAGKRNAKNSG